MPADSAIRGTGVYVRTADGWFASARAMKPGHAYEDLALYGDFGDEDSPVPISEAREIVMVWSEALYRGFWFGLGSVWTADGTRVRCPSAPGTPDRFGALFYDGPDNDIVASLPGAEVHNPRGSNGGITMLVRLDDLQGYRETLEPVTGVTQA
ncbi:hypothetical protein ACH3VR_12960 [Microbacterium sp. B2969]|uniref:Nucleotide modification associated domain-containing protein n=1 Tax=Microbacterium alkaliflavum TaxID=3248839 RepID=A0ABW7Q8S0_9MICO